MDIKKNKFIQIIFISLILIVLNFSNIFASVDVNSYDYLKLKINNNIEFGVDFENEYKISFIDLDSFFLPKTINDSQYLNNFSSSYNGNYDVIIEDEREFLRFTYNQDDLKEKNIINNLFILESLKNLPIIKNEVKYPIETVNSEYLKYLKFEELIDIDDEIKKQASILAEGESDTFIIAAKIAKWIREDINYDLKTALENPNQKSSEVFISKSGVCKEITNLYVSMIRSLGIPARVVSGYAYTNSDELVEFLNSNWGGHAWSEVLIGDIWVPFDLTYNQYGYVDASHIVLEKAKNSEQSSVSVNGNGYGFKFSPNSLKVDNKFELLEKENLEKFNQKKSFKIQVTGPNELGFNSYGFLKLNVENLENYYQVLFLNLVKVEEVELLDSKTKMIILKPNEKKEIYFRYKIPKLNSAYVYTLPFSLQNDFLNVGFNVTSKNEFESINKIELPNDVVESKEFSSNDLLFDCNFIFSVPENNILCSVKNKNNYEINNINICVEDDCEKLDLKLNEINSINFYTNNFEEIIRYDYNLKCESKSGCFKKGEFKVSIDKPEIIFNKSLNANYLNLSYKINGDYNGVLVEININDEKIGTFKNKFSQIIKLKKGINKIQMNAIYMGEIIDSKNFEVNVLKTKIELFEDSLNFFEKIIYWISNLELFKN